ncbi:cytochrome P450 [Micromonospora echinaurantiaca]|uniref:cytochrome P450 n=1 Tax=Micromonospora echinaurantiaca TaxID=47857 RepID=UPI00341233C8
MTVLRYDEAEVAGLADPYPHYAELRAAGRVVPAGPGAWAVTRHADVTALLTDPRLSHEFPDLVYRLSGEPDELTEFFRATVLNRDPPQHSTLRRAMARTVNPRTVAALRPRIVELVAELFAAMADAPAADLVADLAYPLPVTVAAELLGIPVADRAEAQPHAVALGRMFGSGAPTEQERADAVRAVGWLRGYVGGLLRERAGRDGDDMLSHLLRDAEATGTISRAELVDNVIFLFFAGFETTTNLLSTGGALLLHRPELLDRLRRDPGLAPGAVEEFLRWDCPIHATSRVVREPVTVGDRLIRARRVVVLLLASANRDERRFPEPDRIDLARSPNPHLAFSSGPHHCLGATLARVEGAAVFGHLATRLRRFEATGPAHRRTGLGFRGYDRIPVRVVCN